MSSPLRSSFTPRRRKHSGIIARLSHEAFGDYREIVPRDVPYREFAPGDRGHTDEGAYLYHIGQHPVGGPVQLLHAGYGEQVGAYALYLRAHAHEHAAELLHIGFAGGVVDSGLSLREDGGHYDIGRSGHGSLVEKHVAALHRAASVEVVCPLVRIVGAGGAELHEAGDMGIHPAAAYLVSSRLGEIRLAETGEHRAGYHHRAAQLRTASHEIRAAYVHLVDMSCHKDIFAFRRAAHCHAHSLEQVDEVEYVGNLRDVRNPYRLRSEERRTDHLERLVLGSLGLYLPAETVSSLYDE